VGFPIACKWQRSLLSFIFLNKELSMSDSNATVLSSSDDDRRSLRERMSQDLQLRGMAKRTHDGYLREVRKLACYYMTSPDQLSQQQVGDYLLYLINDCNFAPGSLSVAYSGIKFFYTFTEPRDWDVLKKLRLPKQKTLPAVMTIEEVHRLIGAVQQHRNAAYFWTRRE
jgi:site-specific recombinase XerD